MATLRKQEFTDHITYEVTDPAMPSYRLVIYKENHLHMEMLADWSVVLGGPQPYTSWQEYIADVEAGNVVVLL